MQLLLPHVERLFYLVSGQSMWQYGRAREPTIIEIEKIRPEICIFELKSKVECRRIKVCESVGARTAASRTSLYRIVRGRAVPINLPWHGPWPQCCGYDTLVTIRKCSSLSRGVGIAPRNVVSKVPLKGIMEALKLPLH